MATAECIRAVAGHFAAAASVKVLAIAHVTDKVAKAIDRQLDRPQLDLSLIFEYLRLRFHRHRMPARQAMPPCLTFLLPSISFEF